MNQRTPADSQSSQDDEKRRFSRVPFNANATLIQQDHQCSVVVLDLSLKGALLKAVNLPAFDLQRLMQLKLRLSDTVTITMDLRYVRHLDDTTGFECECIDVESIGHLRRLIELNIGDPEAAERELNDLFA